MAVMGRNRRAERSREGLAGSREEAAINGVEVPDLGQPIKDGDVICIASRRDSTITKAEVKVSINS